MKVYVSSTYRDLQAHRAAVDQVLRKMGHDVIGMEQYAAEGNRPVARCLRDVELADVYVLLLGWRYGYVPADSNEDGLSITELEYRHALAKQKTVLAFLLDPEEPWPPSAMDSASADSKAAEAISQLRSDVGARYLSGIFTTPADLASEVAAAVASHGLTTSLSELVLNREGVSATSDSMGSFGTGINLDDTSVHAIKDMIARVGRDRAIVVNLGEGNLWWSTRLFLLANLLRSLTLVRQIVFTGRRGRFAGMATPSAVTDQLGARFSELDDFSRSLRRGDSSQDHERETDRQVREWITLWNRGAGAPDEKLVQVGVREELLQEWLGERLISRCIHVEGSPSMSQVQQVVDSLVPDVPLEIIQSPGTSNKASPPDDGETSDLIAQIKVIDRDAFALELAREWVRSGLPRNPAQ